MSKTLSPEYLVFQAWLTALRSGQYTQIRASYGQNSHRCAIGILYAVLGKDPEIEKLEKLGFPWAAEGSIMADNDDGHSFARIADRLESGYYGPPPKRN